MYRPIGRYLIFGFIFFILIIFIGFKIFGGPREKPTPTPAGPVVKSLPEYADTYAEVIMTMDGRVVGDDKHRAIKITVDQFQRRIDIIGGYQGNILETHTFTNNQAAYDVFLRSLRTEGFTTRLKATRYPNDERGQCPLGTRTIFELNDSGESLSRLWASTCGSKVGTFGGSTSALQTLFQGQITDYSTLISKAKVTL